MEHTIAAPEAPKLMKSGPRKETATVRSQPGFTLIELMITVAIVALLAAVAYPAYTDQVRKGVRRAAQAQMMELASREQQFLLSSRSYVPYADIVASGYSLPPEVSAAYTPSIAVGTSTFPAYTITFTAKGSQLRDGNLSLTSDGVKSPADKW